MMKYSYKQILIVAALLTGVPNILMGHSHFIWQFNLLGIIRGIGSGLISMVPIAIIINKWFHQKQGLATSIVLSFSSAAGALFTPAFTALVEQVGWRDSYVLSGILIIAFLLPGILIPYAIAPYEEGLTPYGAEETAEIKAESDSQPRVEGQGVSKLVFFTILVIAVAHTGAGGIIQHFPGYSQINGYGPNIGAMMLSVTLLGSVIFKVMMGSISDRSNPVMANLIMFTVNAIAVVIMLETPNPTMVLVGAFLYGSAYAVPGVGLTLLTREMMGKAHFDKIFPLISFAISTSGALSISFVGYLYDFTGSYTPAFMLAGIVNVLNIVLVLRLSRKIKSQAVVELP